MSPSFEDCKTPSRSHPVYTTPWDAPSQNESFLSLAYSPLTSTRPRQERGFSIENLSPSRQSSLYLTDEEIDDAEDVWMLEQSNPQLRAQGRVVDASDVSDMPLDVDAVNWRQFHIDWLSTMTPALRTD